MEDKFQDIFKKCLKIENRTVSVKTLLSERNLNRIKYDPYYQRNYVWDKIKQTYFIESVILGTEIPPLIFFKSGLKIEVIDGRQRFETLKRFKENEFKLDGKGLMELEFLSSFSFKTLDSEIRDAFLSSNIRIFEYEIINYPNLTSDLEDRIKKEIFRRYNTGITPLTSVEVDNAKYLYDSFSIEIDEFLKKNQTFAKELSYCFLPNHNPEAIQYPELKNLLRRLFVLDQFPISKYAGGSNRVETLDLLYDFATQDLVDAKQTFLEFKFSLDKSLELFSLWATTSDKFKNRLIYEPIVWAIRILNSENIQYEIDPSEFKGYIETNINAFSNIESHYYGNIIRRFETIGNYFNSISDFSFNEFIRDKSFSSRIKQKLTDRSEEDNKIDKFQNLRYNKPAPISTPIEEIIEDVYSNKYLVRPPYQRKEKISEFKASSIIESILLGINLPPLFIYKRKNGVKEVIDGQQRLLSILGFMGKEYQNEFGIKVLSKNNSFKIKGLKILSNLNGSNYSKLTPADQDKILDFTVDLIIIEEQLNKLFEPTDLFIRLNNKPYPIRQNSFEMWNSTVDFEVIQLIKEITNRHIKWFYIKETTTDPNERRDRMENEEFITILAYLLYNRSLKVPNKIIGFFKRNNEVTCRLQYKSGLSDFLQKLENEANEKNLFIKSIKDVDSQIIELERYLDTEDIDIKKLKLNEMLNVSSKPTYRRSLQDFYILWLKLANYPDNIISVRKIESVVDVLKRFRNVDNFTVDNSYIDALESELTK